MKSLSSVIKSFRVIEKQFSNEKKEENNNIDSDIRNTLIQEAKKEYEDIISEAKKKSQSIIEEAESQKESMINSAYTRAREILEETKETGYKEGHAAGYEDGLEKGYEEGYESGKKVSDGLIQESLQIKDSYLKMKADLLESLEEDIIDLVINIYEKVINQKNEEDNELIISLVLSGIENLDLSDKLTIIVSKEDYNILEMNRDEILAKASMISELDIKYDMNYRKGECILETTKGSIDVSLKSQLDEVRELLTNILNNE